MLVVRHRGSARATPYPCCVSAMREELHHWVDQLPEVELKPALQLIRGRMDIERHGGRNLPFFGSFEADPDLAENRRLTSANARVPLARSHLRGLVIPLTAMCR